MQTRTTERTSQKQEGKAKAEAEAKAKRSKSKSKSNSQSKQQQGELQGLTHVVGFHSASLSHPENLPAGHHALRHWPVRTCQFFRHHRPKHLSSRPLDLCRPSADSRSNSSRTCFFCNPLVIQGAPAYKNKKK